MDTARVSPEEIDALIAEAAMALPADWAASPDRDALVKQALEGLGATKLARLESLRSAIHMSSDFIRTKYSHLGQAWEAAQTLGFIGNAMNEDGTGLVRQESPVESTLADVARIALARCKAPVPTPETIQRMVNAIGSVMLDFSRLHGFCAPLMQRGRFHSWAWTVSVPELLDGEGEDPGPGAAEDGQTLWLDAMLMNHLEKLWTTDAGPAAIQAIRNTAAKRFATGSPLSVWRLWRSTFYTVSEGKPIGPDRLIQDRGNEEVRSLPRVLVLVAEFIWEGRLKAQLKLEHENCAGVVMAVNLDRLMPAMMVNQLDLSLEDGPTVIRDQRGKELARIAAVDDRIMTKIYRGLGALGNVTGHRLIRSLVLRSHAQWLSGTSAGGLYNVVTYENGWSGLGEAIGYSKRDNAQLKAILTAGQHIEWASSEVDGGGLWTWSYHRGGPGTPGRVVVTLSDALTPGLAARMGGTSPRARLARRLVPELRLPPPVSAIGYEAGWGKVWTLHRLALVELVDKAEGLAKTGSVKITMKRWQKLAKLAGVPQTKLTAVLDGWQAGEMEPVEAPALLKYIGADCWNLADSHEAEREFIAAGGRLRTAGRRRSRDGRKQRS